MVCSLRSMREIDDETLLVITHCDDRKQSWYVNHLRRLRRAISDALDRLFPLTPW